MLRVLPIPCLNDNYAYLVVTPAGEAAIVDASDAAPIRAAIAHEGVRPRAIWSTHHHWDHVGGNSALAREFDLDVFGFAGDEARLPGITRRVQDNETFAFSGVEVRCLHVPGHTLGAIAYEVALGAERVVFTGDTLFSAGCGRLFEGTGAQMAESLARLARLPADTRMYCGHEYTEENLRFAASVEPSNPAIASARQTAAEQRGRGVPTIGTTLEHERAVNPFLRLQSFELRSRLGISASATESEAFVAVREAKNTFR